MKSLTQINILLLYVLDMDGSNVLKNVIVIQKHISHDNARHLHSSHLEYTLVCSRWRIFALGRKKCKESQILFVEQKNQESAAHRDFLCVRSSSSGGGFRKSNKICTAWLLEISCWVIYYCCAREERGGWGGGAQEEKQHQVYDETKDSFCFISFYRFLQSLACWKMKCK